MVKTSILKKRTYKKKRSIAKSRVSLATKMYVKKAISINAENKYYIDYGINIPITTVFGTTPTALVLVPRINQGVQKSQRVGNEIKVKRAVVQGYVNLLPYNATTNTKPAPVMIKMWVVSNKQINGIILSATNIGTQFFDVVNGATGLQGNMLDLLFTVNPESWRVHKSKQFELGYTSGSVTGAAYDNSKFNHKFSFDVTKHLNTIKYDDTAVAPTNKNLYLIMQSVYPDGTSDSVVSAEYHFVYKVEYEDV